MKDKRFNIVVSAKITETTTGTELPFANDTIEYFDVPYPDVVMVEGTWAKFHEMLVELGKERVKKVK